MSNRIKAIIYVIFVIIGLVYVNLHYYINVPGNNANAINLVINKGYSIKRVGKELVQFNLINNAKIFMIVKRIFFPNYILKAGEFSIPPHATLTEVLKILDKGDVIIHKLIILEGMTTQEIIANISVNKTLIGGITREYKDGDFIADTYHYTYGESRMALLERIFNRSQITIDNLWKERPPNLILKNKQEAVVLASIIEKETGIASERPRIAAVFTNRLKKKMRLQADPTVIYAVTEGKYTLARPITKADLRLNSPYNTYVYAGLPPTAIANPGKAALEAALNPMKTNELFFVADGKGGHNFSATLIKHNEHVNNYRNGITQNDN
jgi:UPF0755 protein